MQRQVFAEDLETTENGCWDFNAIENDCWGKDKKMTTEGEIWQNNTVESENATENKNHQNKYGKFPFFWEQHSGTFWNISAGVANWLYILKYLTPENGMNTITDLNRTECIKHSCFTQLW